MGFYDEPIQKTPTKPKQTGGFYDEPIETQSIEPKPRLSAMDAIRSLSKKIGLPQKQTTIPLFGTETTKAIETIKNPRIMQPGTPKQVRTGNVHVDNALKKVQVSYDEASKIGIVPPMPFGLSKDTGDVIRQIDNQNEKKKFEKYESMRDPVTGKLPAITALEQTKQIFTDPTRLPFVGQAPLVIKGVQIADSYKKLQDGTADELDVMRMQNFIDDTERDKTKGATILDAAAQSLTFGVELGGSGGLENTARLLTKKGIKELGEKIATEEGKKLLQQQLKTVGKNVGKKFIESPVKMVGRVAENTIERTLPTIDWDTLSQSEKGKFHAEISEKGQDVPLALLYSTIGAGIEGASEASGDIFGIAGKALSKPLATQLAKTAIGTAVLNMGGKVAQNSVLKAFNETLKKIGWNGFVGEMGEEYIGSTMHGIATELGIDDTGWRFPTKQDLLTFAGSVGLIQTLVMGYNRVGKYSEQQAQKKATSALNEIYDSVGKKIQQGTDLETIKQDITSLGFDNQQADILIKNAQEQATKITLDKIKAIAEQARKEASFNTKPEENSTSEFPNNSLMEEAKNQSEEIGTIKEFLSQFDDPIDAAVQGELGPDESRYLDTRDEEFAKNLGTDKGYKTTKKTSLGKPILKFLKKNYGVSDVGLIESAKDAITIGQKLGYKPEDIAHYLVRNYVPGGIEFLEGNGKAPDLNKFYNKATGKESLQVQEPFFNRKKDPRILKDLSDAQINLYAEHVEISQRMNEGSLSEEKGNAELRRVNKEFIDSLTDSQKQQLIESDKKNTPEPKFNKKLQEVVAKRKTLKEKAVDLERVKKLLKQHGITGVNPRIVQWILTQEGSQAWGVYIGGTLSFENLVQAYTEDHEVFHLIFEQMDNLPHFDKFDKKGLYDEARTIYGDDLSESDLEEQMAIDFQQYVNERENNKPITAVDTIKDFFNRLYAFFKRVFTKQNDITELYRTINKGKANTTTEVKNRMSESFNRMADEGIVDFRKKQKTIESPQFKNWFGDWQNNPENSSKIVDESGKPLVVYHGTNSSEFEVFDKKYIGNRDSGWFGKGFYFALSKAEAGTYGRNVVPVYLNIRNPFDFSKYYKGIEDFKGYGYTDTYVLSKMSEDVAGLNTAIKGTIYKKGNESTDFNRIGQDVTLGSYKKMVENENLTPKPTKIEDRGKTTISYEYKDIYGKEQWYDTYGDKPIPNELLKYVIFDKKYQTDFDIGGLYGVERKIADSYGDQFTKELKDLGYDGTMQSPDGDEYVAFEPNQIKSATENITFDPENQNIKFNKKQQFDEDGEPIIQLDEEETVEPTPKNPPVATAKEALDLAEKRVGTSPVDIQKLRKQKEKVEKSLENYEENPEAHIKAYKEDKGPMYEQKIQDLDERIQQAEIINASIPSIINTGIFTNDEIAVMLAPENIQKQKTIAKKNVELSPELQQIDETIQKLSSQIEISEDLLKEHPGRKLTSLTFNKEGAFEDLQNPYEDALGNKRTPEETEKIKNKNDKVLALTRNAFDGTPFESQYDNPDVIREQIDSYRDQKKNIEALKKERADMKKQFYRDRNVYYGELRDREAINDIVSKHERENVIREAYRIIKEEGKSRKERVEAIRDHFYMTQGELNQVMGNVDYRVVSDAEFETLMEDLLKKSFDIAKHSAMVAEVENTIKQKQLKNTENLQEAMKLSRNLKDISTENLEQLNKLLGMFEDEDVFLGTREIETLAKNTDLPEVKTQRQIIHAIFPGISVEKLKAVQAKWNDYLQSPTALSQDDPFKQYMVLYLRELVIKEEAEYRAIEKKVNELAKKARASRPRRLLDKLVPTDQIVREYLEEETPEVKTDIAKMMTPEELEFAHYLQEGWTEKRDYLLKQEVLENYRENYVTHRKRGFLEAWLKSDSPMPEKFKWLRNFGRALKETFYDQQKLDQVQLNILNQKTGTILPLEKWFKYAMSRSGNLIPTNNMATAYLGYEKTFGRKKTLDMYMPKLEAVARALAPTQTTEKGLVMDETLLNFVKEFINTQKGRPMSFGPVLAPGSDLDIGIRLTVAFVRFKALAYNVVSQLTAPVGEQYATFANIGTKKYALGLIRARAAKGKKIIEKYESFIGESVYQKLIQQSKDIGSKIGETAFAGFSIASRQANIVHLLGELTQEELETGEITDKRLAEIKNEMGRLRSDEQLAGIVAKTSVGGVVRQFKSWAIPMASQVIKNLKKMGVMLKEGGIKDGGKKVLQSREFWETVRITVPSLIFITLMHAIFSRLEKKKDRSFVEQVTYKAMQEVSSGLSALTPSTFIAVPAAVDWIITTTAAMETFLAGLKSNTINKEGNRPGSKQLKSAFTPAIVRQFKKNPDKLPGNLETALNKQKEQRDTEKSDAEDTYADLKKIKSGVERKQKLIDIAKNNPDQAKKILDIIEQESKGLTPKDRGIMRLGVENGARAQYIVNEMNSIKKGVDKKQLLIEYAEKGIISSKVLAQVVALLEQNK
jgi:hypothetical protein